MFAQFTTEFVLAVLFLVIGNPMTYQIVDKLAMGIIDISNEDGSPTQVGVFVHSLVFALLFFVLKTYVMKL
jgi:hypothetical protein